MTTPIRTPFKLLDADGLLAPGVDLSGAGVVKICIQGGAFANRAGAAPSFVAGGTGGGLYYYEWDATELAAIAAAGATWGVVQVLIANYQLVSEREDFGTLADQLAAAVTAINAHTDSALAPVSASLAIIEGLHHRNAMLDGGAGQPAIQYNTRKLMTMGRLRVFASSTALAAATPGGADGADDEIQRYVLVGTDRGDGTVAQFMHTQVYP